MAKSLADAVAAFHAAQASVAAAEERAAQERGKLADARTELAAAIVAEAQGGMRQRDIVKITGYSRERVRQILRAGGVEPE